MPRHTLNLQLSSTELLQTWPGSVLADQHLPKISQAESGSSDKPRTITDKQFLISLSFLAGDQCDEFMHLDNRSNFPTVWRTYLCATSPYLSEKSYAKFSGFFCWGFIQYGAGKQKTNSRFLLTNVFLFAGP